MKRLYEKSKNKIKKDKINWKTPLLFFILFLIFLFAFGIRILRLTHFPIFADEAIYIRWAQVMRSEPGLRFLPLSDGKQPLFMWTMIPFLKVFSDPLFAGRLLSVFTGLGTLLGIALLSFELSKSRKVSLMSSVFYAFSPFTVFFDRMALVDSMLMFFGVWAFYFSILAVRRLQFGFAMLAGFALGGALLTKSPSLFFSLLLPSVWILANWKRNGKKNFILTLSLLGLSLITYLIAYAMQNIMRLGENFHLLSSRNYDYVYPLRHILENPLDPFIPHLKDILGWFYSLGPAIMVLFALGGLVYIIRNKKKEGLLLALWFLFPVLVQAEYARVFTARYILFTLPYLIILSSYSLFLKGKVLKLLLYIVVLVFLSWSMVQNYFIIINPERANLPRSERSGYLEDWTSGYGIREVSDYIETQIKDLPGGRQVVVGTEGYFGTLPDGLQIYFDKSNVKVIGLGLDFKEVPKSLIESKDAGNSTYFVVNDSRFLIKDYQNLGLELIREYPKAVKPNGKRDKLLLFKLN